MELVRERAALRDACEAARGRGVSVGLVPTMGALHAGHTSLLDRARAECGYVAASIFVNPLQFGPGEDLEAYPRDLDRDLQGAEEHGVDLVFAPERGEVYPRGDPTITVDPGPLGGRLEGASRPGHFRGVCTVVAKLFGLAGRCRAYFGEKDFQQLAILRGMVQDLDFPVEVVGCPTVRESDGLALSSRNARLSREEREAAVCLHAALLQAAVLAKDGERDPHVLRAEMAKRIGAEPLARIDYVAVVDERTLEDLQTLRPPARALVAARIGATRLIDNLPLSVRG